MFVAMSALIALLAAPVVGQQRRGAARDRRRPDVSRDIGPRAETAAHLGECEISSLCRKKLNELEHWNDRMTDRDLNVILRMYNKVHQYINLLYMSRKNGLEIGTSIQ